MQLRGAMSLAFLVHLFFCALALDVRVERQNAGNGVHAVQNQAQSVTDVQEEAVAALSHDEKPKLVHPRPVQNFFIKGLQNLKPHVHHKRESRLEKVSHLKIQVPKKMETHLAGSHNRSSHHDASNQTLVNHTAHTAVRSGKVVLKHATHPPAKVAVHHTHLASNVFNGSRVALSAAAAAQTCTCEALSCSAKDAMNFMNCIDASCGHPECRCASTQYVDACHELSGTCSQLFFSCSDLRVIIATTQASLDEALELYSSPAPAPVAAAGVAAAGGNATRISVHHVFAPAPFPANPDAHDFKLATTTGDDEEDDDSNYTPTDLNVTERTYMELRELKEEKCRLELNEKDGWVNARHQRHLIMHDVQSRMATLEALRVPVPEMHCEKDFEEWDYYTLDTLPSVPQSSAVRASAMALVIAVMWH